jgi:RimJ/RimL family protein N-acetyltransferase
MSHYSDVVELWRQVGLDPRVEGRDNPDHMENQLETGNVVLLGKFIANSLVGVVLITDDNRKGWINRLAVHPNNQKRGIGKELLIAAEDYLHKEKGIEVYSALIFRDNVVSKQCFHSVGYEQWEEVCYFSKRLRDKS